MVTRKTTIDPDTLSHEDVLGATNARFAGDYRSPEDKLVSALFQRAKVDGMTAKQAADNFGLGNDPNVVEYIQSLLDRGLLDNPNRRNN